MSSNPNCVAIVSGGLDSTTLVYHLLDKGFIPHLVSFDYGQRHKKELQYAAMTAKNLNLRHDIVDLTGITRLISNSALTSQSDNRFAAAKAAGMLVTDEMLASEKAIEVPDGHYAEETMKQTVVPNRNMIMLSIAAGIAVNNKYETIAIGVHAGDHFIYPDCRPEFIDAASETIAIGNKGFHNFNGGEAPIYAPFINWSKADIAYEALELLVPLHLTWSCYKGNAKHCGRCGTCVERLEAIDAAIRLWESMPDDEGNQRAALDLTEYEDTEYWKHAVREAKTTNG